ncbi:MAG: helix-turn-helix transcriptional regulator [candidate division Zixibacteria bacterium]|nr:helix-turn-helix transcriptional regulator [candidate division Zixibacteria bacterium]
MSSNIIKILANKQWSQRKLAGASGLDPVYINRIINEKRDVRISTARKLAKALDCTIDDLFPVVELPENTSDKMPVEKLEII